MDRAPYTRPAVGIMELDIAAMRDLPLSVWRGGGVLHGALTGEVTSTEALPTRGIDITFCSMWRMHHRVYISIARVGGVGGLDITGLTSISAVGRMRKAW